MNDFAYARVTTIDAAQRAMRAHPDALFLAGGTTAVDLLRENVLRPPTVIDISGLPLREIKVGRDKTEIGAMVSNSDLAWNPAIAALFPVLSQAILAGASGQIRNMASVGGNLLQRTRCPYFRDLTAGCNKRQPGTGCAAIGGFNRSHAILGGSDHCVATHPSDFAVALLALDAGVRILGADRERVTPIADFYVLPGSTPERETTLGQGELILGVELPHTSHRTLSKYLKVRDRQSYEFALASAAVAVDFAEGVLRHVRIAFGGIATIPWRAREAERVLEGHQPGPALFVQAALAALAEAQPLSRNGFKAELAQRTLVSVLQDLTGNPAKAAAA